MGEGLVIVDTSVLPFTLACSVVVLELLYLWVRAARLPSTRWRAIWATVGALAFFSLLLTDIGGLGASFAYALTTVSKLPLARIGWAATILLVLVMLGIEVHWLVRKSTGHP